jgi:hypothetical protein
MKIFPTMFLRRFHSLSLIDPERDWISLLIFSSIVLVGLVSWNVYVFDTVANGGVIGTAPTMATSTFNQASLDAIHNVFENRALEEGKYTTGVYRYTDPAQ